MLAVLLLLSISASSAAIPLSSIAEIVSAIQRHFYSTYALLLPTRERSLQPTHKIFGLVKLLAKKRVMTSLLKEVQSVDCCQHHRPLYVIVSSGLQDRPCLNKFMSKPCMFSGIWLLFLPTSSSLEEYFANISIPFDREFLVAQKEDDHVSLTEVYRVSAMLPLQTYRFGNWSERGGLACVSVGLYQRRNSLQGARLKTAVKREFLDHRLFGYRLRTDAFFNRVWLTLEQILDFRSELKLSPDDRYGKQVENGTWDGIMGLMARGEADVTSVELTMEPKRSETVDYIAPLLNDREYLFIKNQNVFESSWTSFLRPFSFRLWLAILATMLLLAFSLCVICQCCQRHGHQDPQTMALSSFSGSLFAISTALCHQGYSEVPQSTSGRLVCAVAHLTVAVLLAAYSASLVSYLAFRLPVLPFHTFSELLNDSTYRLGLHAGSHIGKFDTESMEPALRELYLRQIALNLEDLPVSNLEGFRRVCTKHKYTFLSSVKYANRLSDSIPCQLSIVPNAFIPETHAMAVVKGNPYLGIFRHVMHKLRSTGILQRLNTDVETQLPKNEVPFDVIMDFMSVAPIFGILAVGTLGAISVLLLEFCLHKMKTRITKTSH